MKSQNIRLEWWSGKEWLPADALPFKNEKLAWASLGPNYENYRTVDENGVVLTDRRERGKQFPSFDDTRRIQRT